MCGAYGPGTDVYKRQAFAQAGGYGMRDAHEGVSEPIASRRPQRRRFVAQSGVFAFEKLDARGCFFGAACGVRELFPQQAFDVRNAAREKHRVAVGAGEGCLLYTSRCV